MESSDGEIQRTIDSIKLRDADDHLADYARRERIAYLFSQIKNIALLNLDLFLYIIPIKMTELYDEHLHFIGCFIICVYGYFQSNFSYPDEWYLDKTVFFTKLLNSGNLRKSFLYCISCFINYIRPHLPQLNNLLNKQIELIEYIIYVDKLYNYNNDINFNNDISNNDNNYINMHTTTDI